MNRFERIALSIAILTYFFVILLIAFTVFVDYIQSRSPVPIRDPMFWQVYKILLEIAFIFWIVMVGGSIIFAGTDIV